MNKGLHAVRVKRFSALAPPPLGTALYYPGLPGFGSTIIDRSGKENHGAISGATWTRLPSGLMINSFNGTSNYISADDKVSLRLQYPFTLSAWVYPTSNAGEQCIFTKCSLSAFTHKYWLTWCSVANKFRMGMIIGGVEESIDTTDTYGLNQWYKIDGVYDGATKKLYVNGSLASAILLQTGQIETNTDPFLVGRLNNLLWWSGDIALVRLYTIDHSARQIFNIYRQERHLFNIGV